MFSGIDGRTAGDPALVTADLIDCYGHGCAGTSDGTAPVTWTDNNSNNYDLGIFVSYFQCLLMTSGNPTQAQVAPFVNASDNPSATVFGNQVDVYTAPNVPIDAFNPPDSDLPQIELSISVGRWPKHLYTVPIYASFADGSGNTGLGFSGSASLTAVDYWTY